MAAVSSGSASAIVPRGIERVAEKEPIIESLRIGCGRLLQFGDGPRRILRQPVRHAEVVMRRRELRIESDRALEVLHRLVAPVQHGQQKPDLILQRRRTSDRPCSTRASAPAASPRAFNSRARASMSERVCADRIMIESDAETQRRRGKHVAPLRLRVSASNFGLTSILPATRAAISASGPGPRVRRSDRRSANPPGRRLAEIHVIEGVEQLGAELRAEPLRDREPLAQRRVRVEEVRAEEGIPRHVAERPRSRTAPRSARAAVGVQSAVGVAVARQPASARARRAP